MFSPRRLLATAIAGVALAAGAVAIPGTAAADHGDCELIVNAPSQWRDIYAIASTDVICQSTKNTIAIDAALLRDGVVIDSHVSRTHKKSYWFTYFLKNDSPGDQTWCLRVSVRINPHVIGPVTRCATF